PACNKGAQVIDLAAVRGMQPARCISRFEQDTRLFRIRRQRPQCPARFEDDLTSDWPLALLDLWLEDRVRRKFILRGLTVGCKCLAPFASARQIFGAHKQVEQGV